MPTKWASVVGGLVLSVSAAQANEAESSYALSIKTYLRQPPLTSKSTIRMKIRTEQKRTGGQGQGMLSFAVSVVSFDLIQNMTGPKAAKAANLAQQIRAKGGDNVVAGIHRKRILYQTGKSAPVLVKDETEGNKILGPVAPLLGFLMSRTSMLDEKTDSRLLGVPAMRKYPVLLHREADLELLFFVHSIQKGTIQSWTVELRGTDDFLPLLSLSVVNRRTAIGDLTLQSTREVTLRKLGTSFKKVVEAWEGRLRSLPVIVSRVPFFEGVKLELPDWKNLGPNQERSEAKETASPKYSG